MIRITCKEENSTATVRIAGRLEERHLSGLNVTCDTSARALTLDLSQLQSADSAAIQWLKTQEERGAVIVEASPYVALLLERWVWTSEKPA